MNRPLAKLPSHIALFFSMFSMSPETTPKVFAGREVRIEKNCARGLEYGPRPQAEGRAQDRGHSFSQYGPTKAGK